MHQLETHVQIPTTPHCLNNCHVHNVLTCSAVGVARSLTCPSHSSLELCWCLFFRLKGFKISRLQWRVKIDGIFFAMALSDDKYQFVIVSYQDTIFKLTLLYTSIISSCVSKEHLVCRGSSNGGGKGGGGGSDWFSTDPSLAWSAIADPALAWSAIACNLSQTGKGSPDHTHPHRASSPWPFSTGTRTEQAPPDHWKQAPSPRRHTLIWAKCSLTPGSPHQVGASWPLLWRKQQVLDHPAPPPLPRKREAGRFLMETSCPWSQTTCTRLYLAWAAEAGPPSCPPSSSRRKMKGWQILTRDQLSLVRAPSWCISQL